MRHAGEAHGPVMPEQFRSPAQVAKFKRKQREFDQLLEDLNLVDAEELQHRNSVAVSAEFVRLTEFIG